MNAPFAINLLGWKKLKKTGKLVPNNADSGSDTSKLLAKHTLEALGVAPDVVLPGRAYQPWPCIGTRGLRSPENCATCCGSGACVAR